MAVYKGKVEGMITIPTGGVQALTCTDASGGPTAITIDAGTYYWSTADSDTEDFLAQLSEDINAAMTETWTLTLSADESGTGKLTIGCTGATCTITWQDTNVRDLCGFAGNSSGATSYTGTKHVKALWLPDGPPRSAYGLSDAGADEMDQTTTESSAGHVMTLGYQRRTAQWIEWQGISRAKTRISGESTTGESWQQFVRDVIYAEATYCPGRCLRVYPDAGTDATSTEYRVSGAIPEPEPLIDGWIEQWRIRIPRLLKVP